MRATLIEGISRYHGGDVLDAQYRKIAKRRGREQGPRRVRRARFSRSSTTAYATARSDASRPPRRRVRLGHDQAASSKIGMTHPPAVRSSN